MLAGREVDKHGPHLQDHSLAEERDNTHLILYMYMSAPSNNSLSLETCPGQCSICVVWMDDNNKDYVSWTKEALEKRLNRELE